MGRVMRFLGKIYAPYRGVAGVFSRYWRAYGGASAVILSPYAHFAVLLTVMLWPMWMLGAWWDVALALLPSTLCFTLALFIVWFGFGYERLRRLMVSMRPGRGCRTLIGVSAAYVHFVVVQFVAVIAALVAKSLDIGPGIGPEHLTDTGAVLGHFVGFLLFAYALLVAVAATLGAFRVTAMYERVSAEQPQGKGAYRCDQPGQSAE